ncbi:kinase-like protein [Calocera cornea HHB12733]|uniref:Kinase-like protein n=1 Tax=Calocera cornea HHB12733 TaxID=1353952 RepID=A0A165EQU4_9BASI|nr:kinase-like protein [Calocera cornea HHB12733]
MEPEAQVACMNCVVRARGCNRDASTSICHPCSSEGLGSCRYTEERYYDDLGDILEPSMNFNDHLMPFNWGSMVKFTYGSVYRGDMKDGGIVAVKSLFRDGMTGVLEVQLALRNAWTWSHLDHQNIVPLLGVVDYAKWYPPQVPQLCLVTTWMPAGNIMEYLSSHPEADKISFLLHAVTGLEYLHSQVPPVLHGGLKGNNILIDTQTGTPRARLRDFGHRRLLQQFVDKRERESTYLPPLGNPRWIAFERLNPCKYDIEEESDIESVHSDVFELMRTTLEVFTGRRPFYDVDSDHAVLRMTDKGINPVRPPTNETSPEVDDSMWELMQRSWNGVRSQRPSLSEIREALELRLAGGHLE